MFRVLLQADEGGGAELRWAAFQRALAAPQSLSTQFSRDHPLCSILTRTKALEVQTANILSSTRLPLVPRIPSLADMGLQQYCFLAERADPPRSRVYTPSATITANLISFVCSRTLNSQANELTLLCEVTHFS